jgi:hypothetical protein
MGGGTPKNINLLSLLLFIKRAKTVTALKMAVLYYPQRFYDYYLFIFYIFYILYRVSHDPASSPSERVARPGGAASRSYPPRPTVSDRHN